MKKKKLLSILSTGALALSLFAPISANDSKVAAAEATAPKWDVERYGDRVDIDGQLNLLANDSSFLKQAEAKIAEQAAQINFNEDQSSKSTSASSSFTFDGGTKQFLNRGLKFKPFTLRSVGENVEIWVANDLAFPAGDTRPAHVVTQEQVDKLRDEFDNNIYPKATAFFGTPDIHDGSKSPLAGKNVPAGYYEGSDKVIMLVDNIQDDNYTNPNYPFFVAGFFWQTLENYMDRNIITIDTNNWETRLESTFFGTTIHELQHLIHADNDGAEETWLNEGMSTFSEYLGGYGHDDSSINFYLDHPENSLVNWDEHRTATTGPETIADYGQVYLFTLYMNDKFGREFIRDLALNETQGLNSVNEVLKAHGSSLDFTQLYQNFMTALTLDTDRVGNGVYNFDSIDLRDVVVNQTTGETRGKTVDFEKANTFEKEGVPAWGGDFKELAFQDKVRSISFDGVDFLPIPWQSVNDPLGSDNKVLWGNAGDEADNGLIFEADLSSVNTATLKFDNYIDIEEQWDFGMVQVSTDGGESWTSLENENTRSDVVEEGYPKIKENVPGFTGTYEDWQKETFDLSAYAGQKVLLSFRYLTDWGTTESGWFVDNIEIPEIGYTNDGSSTDAFKSFQELAGQYVNYTVTFINEKEVGNKKGAKTNYKVITVDPFNVTEEDALTLRQLFKDGKNYMITSYAAPAESKDPITFTYEVNLKTKAPKKN
ncbi:immune inhibitor A domain-containing protein [Neobacillus sp. CF12]|uniref:immune inhibitor A domain-containing protein n=1 Tax=Neobacillus sp. CF12 TaxID=3055864 RepID=UPI0025A04F03|nr:immune inhibitor A domain-containing protein [Neobacillus sp. CF12]MDM5329591.1 immune inhibitor A [Neobacillus sp. CF12]